MSRTKDDEPAARARPGLLRFFTAVLRVILAIVLFLRRHLWGTLRSTSEALVSIRVDVGGARRDTTSRPLENSDAPLDRRERRACRRGRRPRPAQRGTSGGSGIDSGSKRTLKRTPSIGSSDTASRPCATRTLRTFPILGERRRRERRRRRVRRRVRRQLRYPSSSLG